jgi:hypothetical protein
VHNHQTGDLSIQINPTEREPMRHKNLYLTPDEDIEEVLTLRWAVLGASLEDGEGEFVSTWMALA